jgi:hypothetical protein
MLYLRLIIFLVGGDILIDSDVLLVTDFVNLKIKSTQSFGCAHIGKMCVHIFIGVSVHMHIRIYIYTVFLKYDNAGHRGR